jgi:hypothetical protein
MGLVAERRRRDPKGWSWRNREGRVEYRIERGKQVAALRARGLSYRQIGEKLSVSATRARQIVARAARVEKAHQSMTSTAELSAR